MVDSGGVATALFSRWHVPILTDILADDCDKWNEIAVALRLPQGVVSNIKASGSGGVLCLKDVLIEWIVGGYPHTREPTVKELKESLRSTVVGRARVASELEQNLIKYGVSPTTLNRTGPRTGSSLDKPGHFNVCYVMLVVSYCVPVLAMGIMYFTMPPDPVTSFTPAMPTDLAGAPATPMDPTPTELQVTECSSSTKSSHECLAIDREEIDWKHLVVLRYRSVDGKEMELRIMDDMEEHKRRLARLFNLNRTAKGGNSDIFQMWIEKGGTETYPSTWNGLIKALKDINFKQLAGEIEEALDCVLNT